MHVKIITITIITQLEAESSLQMTAMQCKAPTETQGHNRFDIQCCNIIISQLYLHDLDGFNR